jgi:TRAP-type C4-dicarboxylate transport system permease small subunit
MWFKSVEKGIHWLSRAFVMISIIDLSVMMVFIGIDVVSGYLFKKPIPGSIDFITLMMVILVFPAFGYLTSLDGQVRTDLLYEKLTKRGKGLCDIVNTLLALFLLVMMTWQLGLRVAGALKNPPGVSTPYFQWPHMPFMIIGALGLTLMGLEVLVQFVHATDDALHGGEGEAAVSDLHGGTSPSEGRQNRTEDM